MRRGRQNDHNAYSSARVDAPADALVDPSPYRSRCGQPVFEVYNTRTEITCSVCAGS